VELTEEKKNDEWMYSSFGNFMKFVLMVFNKPVKFPYKQNDYQQYEEKETRWYRELKQLVANDPKYVYERIGRQ
jgi:hypothetical protein